MKKTICLLVPVLAVLLLSGCLNRSEEVEYITPEELFEYIETHNVGVTIEDFEGIDMEAYIRKGGGFRVGNEISPMFDFRRSIDAYWSDIKRDEINIYLAYEIKHVDSTEEEFEEFKTRFVDSIIRNGMDITSENPLILNSYQFRIEFESDYKYYYTIVQTKELEDLRKYDGNKMKITKGSRKKDEAVLIELISTKFMKMETRGFYYSKDEKYFMLPSGLGEAPGLQYTYDVLKAFHEAG